MDPTGVGPPEEAAGSCDKQMGERLVRCNSCNKHRASALTRLDV